MSAGSDIDMTGTAGDLHQLAAFVGELHGDLMQRILPLIKLTADEREHLALDGLAELGTHHLLTDQEAAQLTEFLCSLRPEAATLREQAARVAGIHHALIAASAGPVALAIAGIASDSARAAARQTEESATFDVQITTWPQADVVGGIVGAAAGLVIGLAGAGPGAVLGGAAAGAVGGSVAFVVAQSAGLLS